MHILVDNVNEAYYRGLQLFNSSEVVSRESRNGPVLEYPGPVLTTYKRPMERVLFDKRRDANPFFHLMEGLWMLNGGRDVASLAKYNSGMMQYSDDGRLFHGAYGYRWREFFGFDQLDVIIRKLQENQDDRRAVLQIWDTHSDLSGKSKDIPCNDMVFFKVREGRLDMTVACRSNDMIWGAYGANAVHFSMLQEYMAAAIGVRVGRYSQMSDSLHVYTSVWDSKRVEYPQLDDPYDTQEVTPHPMVRDWRTFLEDVRLFWTSDWREALFYSNPFFCDVAQPIRCAWFARKEEGDDVALSILESCKATDWKRACVEWIERRNK